jgi:putative addiction module component (TIGR02574 family)
MNEHAAQLLEEILKLSIPERLKIADALYDSLGGPLPSSAEQAAIDGAWAAEIARRLDRYEVDGRTIPWEEVKARLRAETDARPQPPDQAPPT